MKNDDKKFQPLTIRYIGGPTALLELGGLRILTDPTFDPPGDYPIGSRVLTKLAGPALSADAVGDVDLVLLSHDQHPDNLDHSGREYVLNASRVFSTSTARSRLGERVEALPNWQRADVPLPNKGVLHITGVPALHGPEGSEPLVGEVTGFVLSGENLPTVYISGDNASLRIVRDIAERISHIDVALLFAGAAQTPLVPGENLTLTSAEAAEAAKILDASFVIPLHFEHWKHFTQNGDTLVKAFEQNGRQNRFHLLKPGEKIVIQS